MRKFIRRYIFMIKLADSIHNMRLLIIIGMMGI